MFPCSWWPVCISGSFKPWDCNGLHRLRSGSRISSHFPKHILSLSRASPGAPRWIKFFPKNWKGRHTTPARNQEETISPTSCKAPGRKLGLWRKWLCEDEQTFSLSIQSHPGKPIAVFLMGTLAREILRISLPLIPLGISSRVPVFSCTRLLPKWHSNLCSKDYFLSLVKFSHSYSRPFSNIISCIYI